MVDMPPGAAAQDRGLLGTLLPAIRHIFSGLGWKDQVRCTLVCRQLGVVVAQESTELDLDWSNMPWEVDDRPFRAFTQLQSVTITIPEDFRPQPWHVRLLEMLMTQPPLKRLKMEVCDCGPGGILVPVLALLPRCTGLEALDLCWDMYRRPWISLEPPDMEDAVRLCSFPHMKDLRLRGAACHTEQQGAPLGLLSIWERERDPEAFRQLQALKLTFPDWYPAPFLGDTIADKLTRMGARLAEVTGKQLRILTIHFQRPALSKKAQALLPLIAGACAHSSQPVQLQLEGVVWGGHLECLVAAGSSWSVKALTLGELNRHHILIRAMNSGLLAGLRRLRLGAARTAYELAQEVLHSLSGTPLVCPSLADLDLDLRWWEMEKPFMSALRTATGNPGRKLERIILDSQKVSDEAAEAFCSHDLRYPCLTVLELSDLEPLGIARVGQALQAACEKSEQVTFIAKGFWGLEVSPYKDVFKHLSPQPDREVYQENPARALGLKVFQIEGSYK